MSDSANPSVWPCFTYGDARAAIAFLQAAFGFTLTACHPPDGDVVHHAELRWPNGGGIMLGTRHDDGPPGPPTGSGMTYVVTPEPDALHDRAVAAGATIVDGLHDTDYGSRDFSARDPEGNLWAFGTFAGE